MIPIALGVIGLDRLTKALVMYNMHPGDSIPVVSGYFELTFVHNTGAAFGMLSSMDPKYSIPLFAVATVLAVGLLLYFARHARSDEKWLLAALALVMGGAVGNLSDRMFFGYVVDFIDWHYGVSHWPAFNVADSAITVGVVMLFASVLFVKGPRKGSEAGTDG